MRAETGRAFGAVASSGRGRLLRRFDGERRWQNVESVTDYVVCDSPRVEMTPANPGEEKFFVGLRLTEGVRPNSDDWRRYEVPIRRFLDSGLLERADGALRLTPRGIMISNEVFQEFLDI